MKHRSLLYILLVGILSSCALDQEMALPSSSDDVIYASFGNVGTKTAVDSTLHMHWEIGDMIKTFPSESVYQCSSIEDGRGVFSKISGDTSTDDKYATLYYQDNVRLTEPNLQVHFLSSQKYTPDTFSPAANVMFAIKDEDSKEFIFYSKCSYLVVSLYGDGCVESVELRSNTDDYLSGYFVWNLKEDSYSFIPDGGESICLTSDSPVCLGKTADKATDFWFVVPEMTFQQGFNVVVTSELKRNVTFSTNEKRSTEINVIHKLQPVEVRFPNDPSIILENNNYTVRFSEESCVVPVYSNIDFDVILEPDVSWVRGWSYDSQSHKVSFELDTNNGDDYRSANVIFRSKDGSLFSSAKITQFHAHSLVNVTDTIHVYYNERYIPSIEMLTEDVVYLGEGLRGFLGIQWDHNSFSLFVTSSRWKDGVADEVLDFVFMKRDTDIKQTVTVRIHGNMKEIENQKADLVHFYNAMNGEQWTHNDNWCSDRPLYEWYGITTDEYGMIWFIDLFENNVSGVIDVSAFRLPSIAVSPYFQGINLCYNNISGNLPPELAELPFEVNLYENKLSGEIPDALSDKIIDYSLWIQNNNLSGKIPDKITSHPTWNDGLWNWVMGGNLFDLEDNPVYPTLGSTVDIYGDPVDFKKIVKTNKLTILFEWFVDCLASDNFYPTVLALYSRYHDLGAEFIGVDFADREDKDAIKQYCESWDTPWQTVSTGAPVRVGPSPSVSILDNTGRLVFCSYSGLEKYSYYNLTEYCTCLNSNERYESTDYSCDGMVSIVQRAAEGKGVELIVVGDGFADIDIESGVYDRLARKAIDAFFDEEPYKSLKDKFNIGIVTAVSKNNMYTSVSDTRFNVWFGNGTAIGGDNDVVMNYAEKAGSLDNATIIVFVNNARYSGTCYYYIGNGGDADYNVGPSIAYCTVQDEGKKYSQVVQHEAGGHGFGKLADEYWYDYSPGIAEESIEELKWFQSVGVYKNVDVTDDPQKVLWGRFLSDSRYAGEGLGVFEGAYLFRKGAYRSTDESIMRYNVGGFNAPSREAIYKRIHKLAYGDDWQYNYEEFVKFDERARKQYQQSAKNRVMRAPMKPFVPLAPPVIMKMDNKN